MEPDDLQCSRNARPQKDGEGVARCPSCSQNAHDETVLAWDKSASWRARGWAGEKSGIFEHPAEHVSAEVMLKI